MAACYSGPDMPAFPLTLFLGCFWLPLYAAQEISVHTHRDGDALVVEAEVDLTASRAQAWDVLTDYGRLAEFVPDLISSRVVERQGARVIIEQTGKVGFLFFVYHAFVRLEVDERAPNEIQARAVKGSFDEMMGRYLLEERNEGVKLRYSGRMVPAFGVPRLLSNAAMRRAVEKQFGALAREIERRAAMMRRPIESSTQGAVAK